MPGSIVGRAGELASLERFLDEVPLWPSTLLLEGEIGAGKTTLWKAAVAAARARGYRVLACHPVESEVSLPFATLGDLLHGVLEEPHPSLPAPQSRALRVALLLDDPDGPPPDQRSVSVATLGVLRSLSEGSPVVIAIDDLQWIDRASGRVLEFVLRRLETERVATIAVLRPREPHLVPTLIDHLIGEGEPRRLTPGPLGPDALDELFRARLGTGFAPPLLRQVATASGGNPLFALELARAVMGGEVRPESGAPLAVPETLQQFVRERLANLPIDVRELLFLAAAASDPSIGLLEEAASAPGADPVGARMDVVLRAGVVEIAEERIRFAHPLFASTLYHSVPDDRRRALHGRLADLAVTLDERARHLALAAERPDAAIAAVLDEAAREAAARGAQAAAADLCEQAYRATPPGDAAAGDRRRIEAAEYHFAAGDTSRARHLLEEMATTVEPGPVRASVLRRLAKVRYRNDSCAVAAELLTRALAEAGDDAALRAGIERDLAWAIALCGDVPDAAEHAGTALRLVDRRDDDEMFPEVLAATGMAGFLLGHGIDSHVMSRSVELERPRPEVPIEWRPTMMLGMMLKWSGDLSGARDHFVALHRAALEAGEETSLPFLLMQLSETATWAGDWVVARRHAEEAHTIALQTGQEPVRATVLYARALVEAHLGEIDKARASAREGLELSERVGSVISMMLNQAVLGFVELSVDDPAAAHARLAPLVAWLDVVGIREPGVVRFVPDEVEALLALGDLQKADELLTPYEADAARLGRTWAMLAAARCRALHTGASGDPLAGAASLQRALEEHAALSPAFDRARALLVLGSMQRRTRKRKAARASLEAARGIFHQLGAKSWSDKAERLLDTGASGVPGDPTHRLTPAERRVAGLVAKGATNQDVADRLFVSLRAVEAHLTSIYRKLDITSRTQLALRLAQGQLPADDRKPDVQSE